MIRIIFLLCLQFLNPVLAKDKLIIPEFSIGWYFPSINNRISRTDFQVAIKFWIDEFSKTHKIEHSTVTLFDHIEKMQSAFNNGELSIIVAPPLLIAKHFDLNLLADGFAGLSATDKPYGMVILARKDKRINQISDIKNSRLVIPKNDALAHVFLDSLVIPQFKQSFSHVFSSVQHLQKQNSIIHQLFFDKADVGVVYLETFNLMAELNPQIKNTIKIIANFPINSPNYSFFHIQFPEQLRKYFIAEIIKLNQSAKSQQIMSDFKMSALIKCPVKSLNPFVRLNKKYNKLKQTISYEPEL